jgi:DNA polymerase-1
MKVLIVDGYNMIYRAKFSGAFNETRNAENLEDKSIVFSFVKSLRAAINQHNPDKVYFVLEGLAKQRISLMEGYKSNRPTEIDSGFNVQRKIIKEIVRSRWPGIITARHGDYECDDVIHAICLHETAQGNQSIIVSTDTDFFQSISESVSVWNPIKKVFAIPPVEPSKYVIWKALKGDTADNIPGFSGIGPKKAEQMILSESALQAFLASDPTFPDKFKLNLKMINFENVNYDQIDFLTTSNTEFNRAYFRKYMTELGFSSLAAEDSKWNSFLKPILKLRTKNDQCE